MCVHRVSSAPLTALNEPGQGAVSAGYLAPSANPSAPASGGAASKPGPDSSEEWMLIFFSAENFNHAFIQVRLRDRN